ncbi:hypothetical protein [Xenorhabdus bovienii]|uniref:hypothetical protein n=1 Tax=Xenorhabdus bovienii TaxID=40576 RepID=UPI00237CE005|nr:hypothetical protein [Xenorhabdus bovienii]MDE1483612.1 hypothetical protein [Xenorhabdus bovienii]MDE9442850.1 hypothetical protein [Xenorhabdus bovienii]
MTKPKMTYSLIETADLIIGQSFKIYINLVSVKDLQNKKIVFSNVKNITVDTQPIAMKISVDKKQAEASVDIFVKSTINDGDSITFNIDTTDNDFATGIFTCKAKKIDPTSLILTVDNAFLDLPPGPNVPSGAHSVCSSVPGSSYCTKVHTVIKDPKGNTLSGVPVLISEDITGNLKKFNIYAADQAAKIEIKTVNSNDQMVINSDGSGNVIFYLYTHKALSSVLQLITMVQGTAFIKPATSPVYAISSDIQSFNYLRWPNIEGFWSGNLISHGPDKFKVMITRYDNAQNNDVIIFYVNGKRTPYIININDVNEDLGKYSHELPYDIFEYGKQSAFSYVVVTLGGDIMPSYPTNLVYMGGAIPEPDPDVKRDYYPCIVYTSAGSVIPENTFINYDSIRRYPANNINSKTGLFLEIVTSDTDKKALPLNAKVTKLTVYINTESGPEDNPTGKFKKDYTPDNGVFTDSAERKYIQVHIPCKDLLNIVPYGETGGYISFAYEVSINGQIKYGKIWKGVIDTRTNASSPCQ